MIGRASEKIPNGKLVKVEVEYDSMIRRVKITGDFFLHPEDAINQIEQSLAGASVYDDEGLLAERVRRVVESSGAIVVGFTPEALVRIVKGAMK